MAKKVFQVLITAVKAIYGFLSCMSPHPIVFDGIRFRTCEALFQWLRFAGQPAVQREILAQLSPMGVKMKARRHRDKLGRGILWDQADSDITLMKKVLLLKLEQHPQLMDELMATGNAIIIEDCTTHDRESARFWGMVNKNGQWIGENLLGRLWMEIRTELNNKSNIIKH